MRRTSSVLLVLIALAVPGGAQEKPDEAGLTRRLKDLARADDTTRDEVIRGFREIPGAMLEEIHALAGRLGGAEKEAARRWLPHPAWAAIFPGTIGDIRRDLKDFLKYNTPVVRGGRGVFLSSLARTPGRPLDELKKALGRLFDEGDSKARLFALEAYNYLGAPEPEKLLPLLDDPDKDVSSAAANLLVRNGDASLVPAVFRIFKRKPTAEATPLSAFLSAWGTPDLVPDLLEMLKESPDLATTIVPMLGALGDERVEPVLLERLETLGKNHFFYLIQALQAVGGAKTIEAVRKHRASLPEEDDRRTMETDLLFRLRDPALATDLVGWLRGGTQGAAAMGGSFVRLGVRSVVPDLVRYVREGRPKIEDRNAALHMIGLLGGPEELPLLLEHLKDGRFSEAAATALAELRDPRSVKPLVEALQVADEPEPFVRALWHLPLAEAESTLLEILDDPEGHEKVVDGAVALAAHSGSPKLKSRLLDLVTVGQGGLLHQAEIAHALASLIGPEDRARLALVKDPTNDLGARQSAYLLTALGDAEGTKRFVELVHSGRYPGRDRRHQNVLLAFSSPPKPLLEEVERAIGGNPEWFDGAEFLAHHGKKTGEAILLKQLGRLQGRFIEPRAASALLRIGNVGAVEALLWKIDTFRLPLEDEERLARAMGEESMPRLRELAQAKRPVHDQAPARLLALRGDEASSRLFVSAVRGDYLDNPLQPQSNVAVMARALARLKAKEARRDFLRLLRSNVPDKRALGLECLGILGDAAALPVIVPFLDDLQPLAYQAFDGAGMEEEGTVSATAISAIETLSGKKFTGTPRERAQAAREWFAKEKK
jgi:HEAT repeat protein